MPRKSDGPRRSDTSTARFILADDEAPHKPPPTIQPIAPQPIAPAPTPSTTAKEKEKEKEKEVAGIKESKDTLVIEVRLELYNCINALQNMELTVTPRILTYPRA